MSSQEFQKKVACHWNPIRIKGFHSKSKQNWIALKIPSDLKDFLKILYQCSIKIQAFPLKSNWNSNKGCPFKLNTIEGFPLKLNQSKQFTGFPMKSI